MGTTKKQRGSRNRQPAKGLVTGPALLAISGALLSLGFAFDISSVYRTGNRISDAFETAATLGARQSAIGGGALSEFIIDAARATLDDPNELSNIHVDVERSDTDTIHVRVTGNASAPSRFARLIGKRDLTVRGRGEATRYPIDMAIVVDLSYSLHRNGAMPALPEALGDFVQHFEDDIDRIALVTYSTWASETIPLSKGFRSAFSEQLPALTPVTDAATDEGLRRANQSFVAAGERAEAERVIVLFTDGPPTAYSDRFRMPDHSSPLYFQGVVAAYINGASYRGLFSSADGRKVRYFDQNGAPVTTDNASYAQSVAPKYLPGKHRVDGHNIRNQAAAHAESQATVLRNAGYRIYVVGYRGAAAGPSHEADQPNPEFLQRLANHNGLVDSHTPAGRAIVAQGANALGPAFANLANDILSTATR